jgi:hypothetical protein
VLTRTSAGTGTTSDTGSKSDPYQQRHPGGSTGGTHSRLSSLDLNLEGSSSLRSDAPPRVRKEKPEPDTSWVEPLKTATQEIKDRALSSLTPDERFTLARFHCWRFGNCTKQEASNKKKATSISGAFASMGLDRVYGEHHRRRIRQLRSPGSRALRRPDYVPARGV